MAAPKPKMAHVNMMTDTIIGNLPLEGLRAVMRGVLASQPSCTPIFEEQTRNYLLETAGRYKEGNLIVQQEDGAFATTALFDDFRKRICCMVGSGMCFQALPLLCQIVDRLSWVTLTGKAAFKGDPFIDRVPAVDGDIVQALTAIQKTLLVPTGSREVSDEEAPPLRALLESLRDCQKTWNDRGQPFLLERALEATTALIEPSALAEVEEPQAEPNDTLPITPFIETFRVNGMILPRIFTGLWQLSSPAWGSASRSKMMQQFSSYVQRGFTAFDMADHYGDAEIIFGRYRSSSPYADSLFAATKYCVFHPMTVSESAVRANVSERCRRLATEKIDLLQFHWQFYEDDQYLKALEYLQQDERVKHLGLCNFDTEHMQRVVDSGIKIVTNQVQFSLIDSRPTMKMAKFCEEHGIKLLTYGTLCGGLLAEKWIGLDPPDLYSEKATPSQRKYYGMIQSWGGWDLFQELLLTLQTIAQKHGVTVSNVATRWVLDFPYVGAVIVGTRMGVSEQSEENLASVGWSLDQEDRDAIETILERSSRQEMFESLGDCGGEYR
ncbi:NADP-dependent oxidoreductase domain-containing protein [Aspergillus karnatakaensis]|uniref:aldo/keto reductase n=1 Tax=Aspergillus karnatakaensis TaxID=1810916 RepID=UPI003CCD17E5